MEESGIQKTLQVTIPNYGYPLKQSLSCTEADTERQQILHVHAQNERKNLILLGISWKQQHGQNIWPVEDNSPDAQVKG